MTTTATTNVVTFTEFLPGNATPNTRLVVSTADLDEITDWLDGKQAEYETGKARDHWGTLRGYDTLIATSDTGQTLVWRAVPAASDQVKSRY